jgi:hypothetical protein
MTPKPLDIYISLMYIYIIEKRTADRTGSEGMIIIFDYNNGKHTVVNTNTGATLFASNYRRDCLRFIRLNRGNV